MGHADQRQRKVEATVILWWRRVLFPTVCFPQMCGLVVNHVVEPWKPRVVSSMPAPSTAIGANNKPDDFGIRG